MSFKVQCFPQIKGGLCLAACHVLVQTQGYHLECIWGSLVKFQGGWGCCKVRVTRAIKVPISAKD